MGTRPPEAPPRVRPEKQRRVLSWLIAKLTMVGALFLVLWSAPSCSTRAHLQIHQSDGLSIVLRELPAEYPSLAPFHYARVIEPNDTFAILEPLQYDVGSQLPFSRGHQHRVFTRHQAEVLAPALAKALNLALPHEVAAFIVSDAQKPHRCTKGLAFVDDDDLHLIIEELRNPFSPGEQISSQQQGSGLELVAGDRQRHYVHHSGGMGAILNWIITSLH